MTNRRSWQFWQYVLIVVLVMVSSLVLSLWLSLPTYQVIQRDPHETIIAVDRPLRRDLVIINHLEDGVWITEYDKISKRVFITKQID